MLISTQKRTHTPRQLRYSFPLKRLRLWNSDYQTTMNFKKMYSDYEMMYIIVYFGDDVVFDVNKNFIKTSSWYATHVY